MKIKVRKEVVNCSVCKKHNEFWYLSDFSYGERLVLYDNRRKYAYLNLLEDKVYDDFLEILTSVLEEIGRPIEITYIQILMDKIFAIACDKIQGTEVEFNCNKKCISCDSDKFEELLIKPETIEIVELPIVTHEEWAKVPDAIKKEKIINAIKKSCSAGEYHY